MFPVGKVLQGAYSSIFRVPGVVVVVKRVVDQDRNAYVLFSDPTGKPTPSNLTPGEISGSVAYPVFKKQPHFLDPGTVWVLKDVSLICPNPKDVYLNIVAANLVQVFSAGQDDLGSVPETSNILDEDLDFSSSPPRSASPPGKQLPFASDAPAAASTPAPLPAPELMEMDKPLPSPAMAASSATPAPTDLIAMTQELVDEFFDEFQMSD